jgi:dihydrofolate synthase/folylpolyglutamate synthase
VIEAGLGGRLDATNVLRPLLSVITNVSLEHTEYLGPTVRAIAREKGGIIKAGVPVVTGASDPEVIAVLKNIAFRRGAPFFESRKLVRVGMGRRGQATTFSGNGFRLPGVRLGLPGRHQETNAALAFAALRLLRRNPGLPAMFPGPTLNAMRSGYARVRRNTGLDGRLQVIRAGGRFIVDVAHNPEGVRVLAEDLTERRLRPSVAVFGVMKDKDYRPMLATLARVVDRIIAVAPRMDRALPARTLCEAGLGSGFSMVMGGTVKRGIRIARQYAGNTPVLVTGSHYVAGEALRVLRGENT